MEALVWTPALFVLRDAADAAAEDANEEAGGLSAFVVFECREVECLAVELLLA